MTTSGELIARALSNGFDQTNRTAREGIAKLEEVGVTIGHLTFAVTRLADTLTPASGGSEPREDGEPFRQPSSAWPKMKAMVSR